MLPFWKNKNGTVKEASRWKRPGAKFNPDRAQRTVDFVETCCHHIKGELAGQPLKLNRWQYEITRGIFGWLRPDGARLFREVYIELPKKNGKSTWGAALGLYLLFADGEKGAEIYSAAADTDQARIIFGMAKKMVEYESDLTEASDNFQRSIVYNGTASVYQVLSADAPTKHGKNSHGILFDELHAQPNRELYDVLKTSTGARRQPLLIMFTTAGFDRDSICWEVHEYAQRVIEGTVKDPSFLPIIYAADESDDWTDPKLWKRANPNFGVSIREDYLRAECERAKVTPGYQNTFKRLHLNIWTEQESRWLSLERWDLGADPINPKELETRECYAGLDLSSNTDLTAEALLFPPASPGEKWKLLVRFWIPEENVHVRVMADGVPYDRWIEAGYIETTPGNVVDKDWIEAAVLKDAMKYKIVNVCYDRLFADQLVQHLENERPGYVTENYIEPDTGKKQKQWCIPIGQGFYSMAAPCKEFERLIEGNMLQHGGHPVLRWNAGNIAIKFDPAGNMKPIKSDPKKRIDGIVAALMALNRAMVEPKEQEEESVYDRRGPISLRLPPEPD